MNIFVTGAAGYIGSVVTERLIEHGHTVVAFDSLLHGHREAVHPAARFVQGDLLDREGLMKAVRDARADAVVHLAAEALIDESVRNPGRFFAANTTGGLNLLDGMVAAGVTRLIFSSTAAVYGEPQAIPIPEDARLQPVNAYGESKLAFERALPWYHRAHGLRHVSLRYFNACGATDRCGEQHTPETHLIPLVLDVALGRRQAIHLFGTDYDTPTARASATTCTCAISPTHTSAAWSTSTASSRRPSTSATGRATPTARSWPRCNASPDAG
jgi:UDP-glucose 4-epimerase